jgi:hypothetical protein
MHAAARATATIATLFAFAVPALGQTVADGGTAEPPSPSVPPPSEPDAPATATSSAAPAPAPATPPTASAPSAPASAQPVPPAQSVAPRTTQRADSARVHLVSTYPDAWLELRSYVDAGSWRRACAAPCDRTLVVEGMEARVVAQGMTTTNIFRIDPGAGTANLRVSGGSATARSIGIAALIGGIPLSLGGMAMFGYGSLEKQDELRTAGIVTLAVGAVAVVGSLPFLVAGSSSVRDGRGSVIARTPSWHGGF